MGLVSDQQRFSHRGLPEAEAQNYPGRSPLLKALRGGATHRLPGPRSGPGFSPAATIASRPR